MIRKILLNTYKKIITVSFNKKNYYEIDNLSLGNQYKMCDYFPLCHICHKVREILYMKYICKNNTFEQCLFNQSACQINCNCNK
jgi:hypothetical protein